MIDLLSKRVQWLAPQEWLHKSVRTLLVGAPGLIFFVVTGDQRGVMFAFAALCLSVPCGDRFYCILIGVSIGTMFMLILSSHPGGRYFQTSAGKDSSHRSSGRLNHPAELIKSKSRVALPS
jgi:hypothetical protein